MNFYDALNQGDGSLREPHLTSLIYYLLKESKIYYPNSSFLDFFITRYLPHLPTSTDCMFDIESDIKVEEILIHENNRRDTDIIIFLRQNNILKIINIENKISTLSYQPGQIEEQNQLLSALYPNSEIENILILPYSTDQVIESEVTNGNIIFWLADENSLKDVILDYIETFLDENQNIETERLYFLKSCSAFFQNFSNYLEQEKLSNENMARGPRNNYRYSMFQYLSNIADNWEEIFQDNPFNVTIGQLLLKFENNVINDLIEDFPNDFEEKIAKFRNGALKEQPKIMTINEQNRIHFGITNPQDKQLFYYPDAADGNIPGQWINKRIKPLRLMNENIEYFIFWKNRQTNDREMTIYAQNE